jgi:hypothetical protein
MAVFLAGALGWLCLVWPFVSRSALYFDARQYCAYINYFLNAVSSGVYPAWDPFNLFGRPDGLMGRISGDNNPFLFLVLLMQKAGLAYPRAYMFFYTGYFLSGMAGFFLLARIFLKDFLAAVAAFFILLFSSFGFCLFNDAQIIMIFVPAVWLVYSLRMFWRRPRARALLAAVLWLDILLMAYLPFFFLTVFIVLGTGFCIFYPRAIVPGLKRAGKFFRARPFVSAMAAGLLLTGFAPAFFMWLAVQKGEWMLDWRSASAAGKGLMQVSLADINNNAYPFFYFSPHYWFSCLKAASFTRFYVPAVVFSGLLVSVFAPVTRRMLFLLAAFGVLFLIGIGSASGLQPFLYEHVFYFRLFRNLHFLLWLAFPLAVLAVAEVYRSGLIWLAGQARWLRVLAVVGAHAGLAYFLWSTQVHVIAAVYVSVILGGLAYLIWLFLPGRRGTGAFLLACAVAVQSGVVFSFYAKNEQAYLEAYRPSPWVDNYAPVFSYQRPSRSAPWMLRDVEGYGAMEDASGFDYPRFTGSRWAMELLNSFPSERLEAYVANKFIVYERAFFEDSPAGRKDALERIFAGDCGGAMIEDPGRGHVPGAHHGCEGKALALKKGGEEFKVLSFGLNHIRFETNWPREKYLVYNDTFSSSWQARLNGRPLRIDRANVAFKGMLLAAGHNVVELTYDPPVKNLFRLALTWGYVVFALAVLWLGLRPSGFFKKRSRGAE